MTRPWLRGCISDTGTTSNDLATLLIPGKENERWQRGMSIADATMIIQFWRTALGRKLTQKGFDLLLKLRQVTAAKLHSRRGASKTRDFTKSVVGQILSIHHTAH